MNNIINISGGNDSVAMLQWFVNNMKHLEGDKFYAVYANTGWAISWWAERIKFVAEFCERNGIEFVEVTSSGMEQLIRKKGIYPNRLQKWCTEELKIKPIAHWKKHNKFTPYNSRMILGVRAEESPKRANTIPWGEVQGFETWYPLALYTEAQRNELVKQAGFEILPHRSCECSPCIFERNKAGISRIEPERIELIANLETDLSAYTNAKRKLQKHPDYNPKDVFGFFNSNNLEIGRSGIREQVKWANTSRGQYVRGQEDVFCDTEAGYCGG